MLELLQNMSPPEFERFIGRLFEIMGYKVIVTQYSQDNGIDIIAEHFEGFAIQKVLIQVKRYIGTVGVSTIRDLYGTLMADPKATSAVLITTGSFSIQAREFARDKRISLIDGPTLVKLLTQYGIVIKTPQPIIEDADIEGGIESEEPTLPVSPDLSASSPVLQVTEEDKESAKELGFYTWFKWIVATTVGWIVGGTVGANLTEQVAALNDRGLWVVVVFGFSFGIVLGTAQWLILRNLVPGIKRWILASAVGWALLGFMIGVPVGITQWLILRKRVRKAGWWVLIIVLDWVISFIVLGTLWLRPFLGPTNGLFVGTSQPLFIILTICGLSSGIITGTGLILLLKFQPGSRNKSATLKAAA